MDSGDLAWRSSLGMTMIESIDQPEDSQLQEYYVPTLNGDILAFSNSYIWNTTAKISDFMESPNFGENLIIGSSE